MRDFELLRAHVLARESWVARESRLVRDFELLRAHVLARESWVARESMLVRFRISVEKGA